MPNQGKSMADEKPTQGGDGYENLHPPEREQRLAGDRLAAEGWRNNKQGRARHEEVRAKPFVTIINLKHLFCGDLPPPLYAHTSPAENNRSPLLGLPPLLRNTKQSQPTAF
jgi:hypothetical protein